MGRFRANLQLSSSLVRAATQLPFIFLMRWSPASHCRPQTKFPSPGHRLLCSSLPLAASRWPGSGWDDDVAFLPHCLLGWRWQLDPQSGRDILNLKDLASDPTISIWLEAWKGLLNLCVSRCPCESGRGVSLDPRKPADCRERVRSRFAWWDCKDRMSPATNYRMLCPAEAWVETLTYKKRYPMTSHMHGRAHSKVQHTLKYARNPFC